MLNKTRIFFVLIGMIFFKIVTKKNKGKINWNISNLSLKAYSCLITRLIGQVRTSVCFNEPIILYNIIIEQQITNTLGITV